MLQTIPQFSIQRANGIISVTVPGQHPDKRLLMNADDFAYLLPRNTDVLSGFQFASLINKHMHTSRIKPSPRVRSLISALRSA